jgi:release factor glutamine methyltransferase
MKTIEEVLKLSALFLEERKVDRAKRVAEDLLSSVLGLKKMDLYLQFDRPVIETELVILRDLLKRYIKGDPFEYVVGKMDFFGCKIKTDRRALIPRPETEIFVELVAKRIQSGVLWDLCTGSGCIGISLKKAWPALSVTLVDLSKEAIELATENAEGMEIEILQGDLLEPLKGRKADFVTCNPPYISQKDFLRLEPSVRDYEPRLALLGGERGTEFYERLSHELPPFLNPGAKVFLEIGFNQEEAIRQIFSRFPWGSLEMIRDYAGHPRFFFLEKLNYLE